MNEKKENKNWTFKDGWERFKKIVSQPEKVESIQERLLKIGSDLNIEDSMFVKVDNRMSQLFTSMADGTTNINFWENGICWHSFSTKNLDAIATAIHLWNKERATSNSIENEVAELTFPTQLKMIEKSNEDYIKWHWNNLINNSAHRSKNEIKLIKLLSKNKLTNKLMTFNQLWDFGLSRYIGDFGEQLKNDLIRATIQENKITVKREKQAVNSIWKGEKGSIGSGTPNEAYELIISNLPKDIGYAKYQTIEEYKQRIKAAANNVYKK